MEDSKFPISIKFTPGEWVVISDRLEIGECIAEALTDDMEAEAAEVYSAEYQAAARRLLYAGPDCEIANNYELLVLQDAIEGSTMPYKAFDMIQYGNDSEKAAGKSYRRHFANVEKKLADAGYPETRFPVR